MNTLHTTLASAFGPSFVAKRTGNFRDVKLGVTVVKQAWGQHQNLLGFQARNAAGYPANSTFTFTRGEVEAFCKAVRNLRETSIAFTINPARYDADKHEIRILSVNGEDLY